MIAWRIEAKLIRKNETGDEKTYEIGVLLPDQDGGVYEAGTAETRIRMLGDSLAKTFENVRNQQL